MSRQQIPARTLRTASIIILAFAVALLLFGFTMFQIGSNPGNTAGELPATGLRGTVTDARVNVGNTNDGIHHIFRAELSFLGSDGADPTLITDHFPRHPSPNSSTQGWIEDFPTKDEIVGQPVSYRMGEHPAVELNSDVPALASAGWSFPNYLGRALLVLGAGVAATIGGTASLVRAVRRLRKA